MKIRENIANQRDAFAKAINSPAFVQTFKGVLGDKNKIIAPHLKEAAAEQPLIFNKQFYVQHPMEAEETLSGNLPALIADIWKVSIPFAKILAGE